MYGGMRSICNWCDEKRGRPVKTVRLCDNLDGAVDTVEGLEALNGECRIGVRRAEDTVEELTDAALVVGAGGVAGRKEAESVSETIRGSESERGRLTRRQGAGPPSRFP